MKALNRCGYVLVIATLFAGLGFSSVAAQEGGIQLGSLICKTIPGTSKNLILSSSVSISCTYKTNQGEEKYKGEIGMLGLDLREKNELTLFFTVVGLTKDVRIGQHSLAGGYLGASISVSIDKGIGSTQFVGGLKRNFSLIPSLDTNRGMGIAAGVSRMNLEPDK